MACDIVLDGVNPLERVCVAVCAWLCVRVSELVTVGVCVEVSERVAVIDLVRDCDGVT